MNDKQKRTPEQQKAFEDMARENGLGIASAPRMWECVNGFAGVPGPIPPCIVRELVDAVKAMVLTAVNHNVADTKGYAIGCGLCGTVMDRAGLHKDWCPVAQVEAILAKLTVEATT